MKYLLTSIVCLLLALNVKAQETYSIVGSVKNQKGEVLASATVFIAGSEKAAASDAEGRFRFNGLTPGTYQVVVNMLGYESAKQNVILKNAAETVSITLATKTILLNDVNIGKSDRKKQIKIFTDAFMGESSNVKYCKILNPDLLEFSTAKGTLKATTSDFLIIENNALGYRIKYLLKTFSHQEAQDLTYYDGDYSFEQMKGTPQQQQKWEKARQEAYEGSLMHYLRSLYAGTTRQEGFLVYKIVSSIFPIVIETIPIPAEQIIKRSETSLITFRYDARFYIVYDKKKAAKPDPTHVGTDELNNLYYYGSIFNTDARVDSRGSFTNYDHIFIQGFWGRKRVADQLPWEYMPPAVDHKN
ncbi:carboxypeptidase-like regulatory domain-containing protein [Mucilaginibacter sp. dw_454]|uniref:carboxypeptidase-like regulatory domain-containing protein n=1 Tax=Mucilaginibacter sp. dw_454 TaxID=2720079 RepID=UPI001BD67727|nr:carboxypeptidase-like regulatory domain-containing protein [Mucilaginibacter sp. dw_454]